MIRNWKKSVGLCGGLIMLHEFDVLGFFEKKRNSLGKPWPWRRARREERRDL